MKKYTTSDRLKEIMSTRSLKQVDILELCKPYCAKYGIKLNKNDLSQYVSGKVVPKQDKLSILGLALNVSEVWLMGYDEFTANIHMTFADNLKYYLALNNKTPKELANYLGKDVRTVQSWLSGHTTPRMNIADKICAFFEIKRSDLLNPKDHSSDIADAIGSSEPELIDKLNKLNPEGIKRIKERADELISLGYIKEPTESCLKAGA